MIAELLPWASPPEAAAALAAEERCWVLLYSGQQLAYTGRYSYLALYPQETVTGGDFSMLAGKLTRDKADTQNAWFGYFGYEMLHATESLPREAASHITLPDLWFTRFGMVLRFDHTLRTVTCHREPHILKPVWPPQASQAQTLPPVESLTSPMPRGEYIRIVGETKKAIARGDFYQANITRKFTGEWATPPDAFSLFRRLCDASPAAYSAFIRMEGAAIISSSPERFLTITAQGNVQSRPIKGTAPRFADQDRDEAARAQLGASEKDRAENLMIVDLMRNDLARSCEAGSVQVEGLFEVSTYATLHHMASTITGTLREGIFALDALRHSFPPGSMTGAPKIRAMQWCMEHERIRRGVYSGALGWFAGDGSCDFSVVIRTLMVQNNLFEFQVGGGIVADSDPEKEWQETLTKARGICKALGVEAGVLEGI